MRVICLLIGLSACGAEPIARVQNEPLAPAADALAGLWTGQADAGTPTLRLQLAGDAFTLDATFANGTLETLTGDYAWEGTAIRFLLAHFRVRATQAEAPAVAVVTGQALCAGDLCAPQRVSLPAEQLGETLTVDLGGLLIGAGHTLPCTLVR